jgi:hypothetical protein
VYVQVGVVLLSDFSNNGAILIGAGFHMSGSAKVSISASRFVRNKVLGHGGSVSIGGSATT